MIQKEEERESPSSFSEQAKISVSVNGHLLMGDEEHSKANGNQRTEGDQHGRTPATGSRQLRTLAVADSGLGNTECVFRITCYVLLGIRHLAALICIHGEIFRLSFANFNLG